MKHIQEAKRYLANAKEILREKGKKQEGFYTDSKYIKMAGDTAYKGLLVALDGVYGKKNKGRKDIDWYKQNISVKNKKLLYPFLHAYEILHLYMGYDGLASYKIANEGFSLAEEIIEKVSA